MNEEEKVNPDTEIKTEFIGCYITDSDKDMLAGMTHFLYMFNFIDDINNSETLRFSINLCYWFVMREMNKFFQKYESHKKTSENNPL